MATGALFHALIESLLLVADDRFDDPISMNFSAIIDLVVLCDIVRVRVCVFL